MKTKNYFLLTLILFFNSLFGQIGIGTTTPEAQLDIRSTNQASPANNDGVLIPKVDVFPAINPTAAQQGMLVYLTTTTTFLATTRSPGFYYWNNPTSDWIGLNSTANGDHDWYEEGTSNPPNAITDNMFHIGNIAIGKNTANYPLDVSSTNVNYGINNNYALSISSALERIAINNTANIDSTGDGIGIKNTLTGGNTGRKIGQYSSITGSGVGDKIGNLNFVDNSSIGSSYGVRNILDGSLGILGVETFGTHTAIIGNRTTNAYGSYNSISNNGSGIHYGTFNLLNGTNTGQKYGVRNELNGNGNQTGTYSVLSGAGSGLQIGSYNEITSGGNNAHTGVLSTLSGTGTGLKTGLYSFIAPAAGGTHYGVYSEVLKVGPTNFAGYFLGNVGIGTTGANTYTLPASRGTVGQTMRTDALGNVTWANNSDFAWSLTGNAVAATNFIGTTNVQPLRFFCNNVERMRINPTDGEIIAGGLASPYAGDVLNAVSTAALPFGINGYSAQNGSGTWGEILAGSTTGFSGVQGVYGGSGNGAGTLGNYNGTGTSITRAGVFGVCSGPTTAAVGAGVYGNNSIAGGNQRIGVLGSYNGASFGIGVHGLAAGGGIIPGNNDIAVVGWRANNNNYSGYFNGNHVIANGTKSASVGTSKGNQLLYVTELPEVWFEDVGGGQLINGSAHIALDELFLETIFVDDTHPMRIFLQEEGESNGLIVIKDPDHKGFTVKEKNGGNSSISFSYRIMAKRLHFQDHRFGNDPVWGEGDTRKYNQYATPPPVDYSENVKFQENQKRNFKQTPMPDGFIDYFQIQNELKKLELEKPKREEKSEN